ncbi:hypothetical protein Hypma_013767 [Hypsizygus marmoreus]|uniref:Uncharacterized protein n=1 Tax=Hypsizygus marmoreus TaxID=39966 RepID=A0A369K559_HYPMA|nr:hypothetical protein Hypma_013767 [Hypsizygus marmoreus]
MSSSPPSPGHLGTIDRASRRFPANRWGMVEMGETNETEARTVRRIGKHSMREMSGHVYYDRLERRVIELDESPLLPAGYVTDRFIFAFLPLTSCSNVSQRHLGQRAARPAPHQLPLLKDRKDGGGDPAPGSDSDDDVMTTITLTSSPPTNPPPYHHQQSHLRRFWPRNQRPL